MALSERYGQLPLVFEPNVGQTDRRVKFLSRAQGSLLFFTQDQVVMSLSAPPREARDTSNARHSFQHADHKDRAPQNKDVLRMTLVHANPAAKITPLDPLSGKSNYFIGSDPSKWHTNIPTYGKVRYEDVYPGIDLVYYGNQRQLEYDFVVKPGVDPHAISLQVSAADSQSTAGDPRLKIVSDGELVVETDHGELRFHKPVVYQLAADSARPSGVLPRGNADSHSRKAHLLDGQYVLSAGNRVQFEIGAYDHSRPLVIDPVLSYSTYLGGSAQNTAAGIKVDASGSAYIVGTTNSTNFPVSVAALQKAYGGSAVCYFSWLCGDAFVTKLSADGTSLVYSTYLGGSGAEDGNAIDIDSSGNAYVTGVTSSTDFPVTPGVVQATCGTGCYGNAFVSKLSPDGSKLVYSTYLGGSDQGATGNFVDTGNGIAVDSSGDAYVTGGAHSTDFPVTAGSFQTTNPNTAESVFVAELNPSATALLYSTYLGGSEEDRAGALAVDAAGCAYVTGLSFSPDFPTTPGAFQIPFGTTSNGIPTTSYVTKLSPDGSSLAYSASLGGTGGTGIAVDSSGSAYVTGSAVDFFPTTSPALGSNCDTNAYVTKLTPDGSGVMYSSQFCLASGAYPEGIAIDSSRSTYLTGLVSSTAFPATAGALQRSIGNACCYSDAFLTKLTPDGSAVMYSTYLGGSSDDHGQAVAVDSAGNTYLTGWTDSTDFPTANPYQATNGSGGAAAFVSKLSLPAEPFSLYPAGLEFGNLGVGVTSTAQPLTLVNISGIVLDISSITATGGFTQTNNCGSSLAAGAQCSIQVAYKPSAAGAGTGSVAVTAAGNKQSVTLSGTGVNGPVISVSPSMPANLNPPLPFFVNQPGYTPGGTTSPPFPITITNLGNADLTFTNFSLVGGPFSFGDIDCFTSLAPLASCVVNVLFTSYGYTSDPGTEVLTLTDNASDSPQHISFTALGADAGVRFLSLGLKFGNQSPGASSAARTVALMNGTSAPVTLGNITTTGDFAQTNNCASTLAVGAYCTFSVTFTPTATGVRQGTLQAALAGGGSPTVLPLLGSNGSLRLVNVSPASLTFDAQNVGTTSTSQSVTLTNFAGTALTMAGISFTGADAGDFAETDNCGGSVAAGGNCTINVTFTPTGGGSRTATLSISDSAAGSPQTVSLTGTGTGAPVVSLSAAPTFPSEPVGTTSPAETVTVTNTGNANLTFSDISTTGPFAIVVSGTTCSTSSPVAPSASCNVAVTLTPTAGGPTSGTLSLADNAGGSPQSMTLAGTGQDFSFAAASGSSTSETVTAGNSATYQLSIAPEGGFSGTVTFACSGAPAEATCSLNPTSQNLTGSTAASTTVSVSTTPASLASQRFLPAVPKQFPGQPAGLLLGWLILLALAAAARRRNALGALRARGRQPVPAFVPAMLMLLALGWVACGGGGGGNNTTHNSGTPAGTYTLTVTAMCTSGSTSLRHTMALELTVN
jgi:hypothetical protein